MLLNPGEKSISLIYMQIMWKKRKKRKVLGGLEDHMHIVGPLSSHTDGMNQKNLSALNMNIHVVLKSHTCLALSLHIW